MTAKTSPPVATDPLSIAVGEQITRVRERHDLARHQLAKLSGMDANYLWRIEAGRQNLSLRNVARLANAFGITLSELLAGISLDGIDLGRRAYTKANSPDE